MCLPSMATLDSTSAPASLSVVSSISCASNMGWAALEAIVYPPPTMVRVTSSSI